MSERVDAVAKDEEIEKYPLDSSEAPYDDPDAMTPDEAETLVAEAEARSPEAPASEALEGLAEGTEVGPLEDNVPEPEIPVAGVAGAEVDEVGEDVLVEARANATEENTVDETAAEANVTEANVAEVDVAEAASGDATEAENQAASAQPEASEVSTDSPAPESDSVSTEPDGSAAESSDSQESESESEDDKRVVRTLAVGEKVAGTIKRIADFGAFVDIGVGRDGLIHISELSIRRVGKVTDMLQEGQEVEAWIKKLDRDRNRISLTLIDPDTKTIRDLQKGDVVKGKVTRLLAYGAFVDIGIGRDALLHVREMAEGFVAKPEDVVSVDEELEARVIDLSRRRSRVDLSLKGLRPEPEAAVPHQSDSRSQESQAAEEEIVEDTYEDVEVLSAMELAFKRAMEAEGIEMPSRKKGKRGRRTSGRDLQDEIIHRTLSDSRR